MELMKIYELMNTYVNLLPDLFDYKTGVFTSKINQNK